MAAAVTAESFGPAVALSCRECGARTALAPDFACIECFGPLEVAYELPTGDPEALRARIEAAEIPDAAKALILRDNAMNFFNLSRSTLINPLKT